MHQDHDDFTLRLQHYYAPAPEPEEPATHELPLPLPNGPAALRPDPAALFRRASAAAVGLAALFVADAEAQNAEPTTMEPIVVQGQQDSPYVARTISSPLYTEPLRDVPQSVTVVPQAVIKEQNATSCAMCPASACRRAKAAAGPAATSSRSAASMRATISSSTASAISAATRAIRSISSRSRW
jgi:outer membrane receptor for monomeric catechols